MVASSAAETLRPADRFNQRQQTTIRVGGIRVNCERGYAATPMSADGAEGLLNKGPQWAQSGRVAFWPKAVSPLSGQ
jgi:hypothetical protein